ncbi:DedA family protein [Gemmobacter serpentinus]|uniref:DedA family protein n=1 Tax=Gemmobacter serpentinus TaxID=2652247 RepID=UPI00186583A9|nr:VTT domain-containing protein [Gemmobacter serpentinus]
MTGAEISAIAAHWGLWALIPLAILEGPVISLVTGWLVSLGLVGLMTGFTLIVIGDVLGDCVLYLIGRGGAQGMARWLPARLCPPRSRVVPLIRGFRRNGVRLLVMGKLTHAAGAPLLLAAGMARMPLGPFLLANLLAALPKAALLIGLGYAFGEAAESMLDWVLAGGAVILALAGLVWLTRRSTLVRA